VGYEDCDNDGKKYQPEIVGAGHDSGRSETEEYGPTGPAERYRLQRSNLEEHSRRGMKVPAESTLQRDMAAGAIIITESSRCIG
jgi:hypothetical protein